MSSSSKLLQLLLRLLMVVGAARFLISSARDTRHHQLEINVGRENKQIRDLSKFDLNYVSKRKIPNGPDPIHNRRTGSSHQPPGQA